MQTLVKHFVMFTLLPNTLSTSVPPTSITIDVANLVNCLAFFIFSRRVLAEFMQEYMTLHCVCDVTNNRPVLAHRRQFIALMTSISLQAIPTHDPDPTRASSTIPATRPDTCKLYYSCHPTRADSTFPAARQAINPPGQFFFTF
jgi:hypothetical protein